MWQWPVESMYLQIEGGFDVAIRAVPYSGRFILGAVLRAEEVLMIENNLEKHLAEKGRAHVGLGMMQVLLFEEEDRCDRADGCTSFERSIRHRP